MIWKLSCGVVRHVSRFVHCGITDISTTPGIIFPELVYALCRRMVISKARTSLPFHCLLPGYKLSAQGLYREYDVTIPVQRRECPYLPLSSHTKLEMHHTVQAQVTYERRQWCPRSGDQSFPTHSALDNVHYVSELIGRAHVAHLASSPPIGLIIHW